MLNVTPGKHAQHQKMHHNNTTGNTLTHLSACLQGTSRGGADLKEIVRRIDLWGLTHLYVVGGNGGNAAANAINQELQNADVICSVIGVPKSIDNDILLVRF